MRENKDMKSFFELDEQKYNAERLLKNPEAIKEFNSQPIRVRKPQLYKGMMETIDNK